MDEAVEKMADTELKKEFMRYALLDEPKSSLGKIVSMAFKKFKEWWERERKQRCITEAKESIRTKLKKYEEKNKTHIKHGNRIKNGIER